MSTVVKPKTPARRQLCDAWTFTLNNPRAKLDPTKWDDLQYLVYQQELSATGTKHFQGYVQFQCRKTFVSVQNMLQSAHLETAKGTDVQNYNYCTKPNAAFPEAAPRLAGPWEYGTRVPKNNTKGGRTDVLKLKSALDAGTHLSEIARNPDYFSTYLQRDRALHHYQDLTMTPRNVKFNDMHVVWIWGPSASGKTTRAVEILSDRGFTTERLHYYRTTTPKANGLRWDHYEYQRAVFLDDFTDSSLKYNELIRMLSERSWRAPIDGGSVEFIATTLVFTSIKHPSEMYIKHLAKQSKDWTELNRRITTIIALTVQHEEGFRGGRHPTPAEQRAIDATVDLAVRLRSNPQPNAWDLITNKSM